MLERDIEKVFKQEITKIGGLCFKLTSPSLNGIPDRAFILNGRTYYVELKQEKGKLRELQKKVIDDMKDHGAIVSVIYSVNGVKEYIADVKKYLPRIIKDEYK